MQKIGRNDPCPCGSGKKYKRCCLEKDQQNKVTRIAPHQQAEDVRDFSHDDFHQQPTYESLVSLVEKKLEWSNYLYQLIAKHIFNNMVPEYDAKEVETAILLWNAFSTEVQPITRKAGVYPAAIEYCIAQISGKEGVTQADLAKKYNSSPGIISKRVGQIMEFVASHFDPGDWENDVYDDIPPSFPNQINMEKQLQKISQLLEGKEFASIDEINAYVNQQLNQPAIPRNVKFLSKQQQAQEILYDAWEEPSIKKRIQLAQKALQLDPNHPDAYNILAETSGSAEESAKYFKQGMQAGERGLGQAYFEENKSHFWGMVETRPYMRSKFGYAEVLMWLGKTKQAVQEFKQLLELNPNDNQGARYLLLPLYIQLRQYRIAMQLINMYKEDETANFNYNRVLLEYTQHGVSDQLVSLLQNAIKQNSYVIDYIVGKRKIPGEVPQYIGYGDTDEAVAYAQDTIHLWKREPELIGWLKEHVNKF